MLRTATKAKAVWRNIEDAESLISHAHYLIMKGQLAGNLCFDGHFPSAEEFQIAEQCRRLCEKMAPTLEICKVSDVPELLFSYDVVYRIGYRCLPDSSFVRKHKQRVFNAWREGDKEIPESSLYEMLLPEVSSRPSGADRDYIDTYLSIKERWLKTLKRYGRFPKVTTYENFKRLSLIARENLTSEIGINSEVVKRQWYELNKIDDLTSVSSLILISYRRFIFSLVPEVLDFATQIDLDTRILRELTTRTDLPPHDLSAFRLALQFNQELA